MTVLTWNSCAPLEPGWYWWRRDFSMDAQVVSVKKFLGPDGTLVVWFSGEAAGNAEWTVEQCPGQWAGPLVPPE